MAGTRKRYSAEFKAQLALEVIKGEKTANEIASQHSVHPTMLPQWKKQLLENAPDLSVDKRSKEVVQDEQIVDLLYLRSRKAPEFIHGDIRLHVFPKT